MAIDEILAALAERAELPYHRGSEFETPPFFTREHFLHLKLDAIFGVRVIRSAGSTGSPLWWVRGHKDVEQERMRWRQALQDAGLTPADRLLVLLPHRDLTEAVLAGGEALGLTGMAATMAELGELAPRFAPTVLMTTPLTAYRAMLEGLFPAISGLLLTGDVGRGVLRTRQGLVAGNLSVREVYALTEHPGPLAVECSAGALHWNLSEGQLEFLEPRHGRPAEAGQVAQVMIRQNDAESIPLYCYATGDLVRMGSGVCACGQSSPHTSSVLGRMQETPVLGGVPLFPADVAESLLSLEGVGTAFNFAVRHDRGRDRDIFAVDLECFPDQDADVLKFRVESLIRKQYQAVPWVNVHAVHALDPSWRLKIWDWRGVYAKHLS